MLCDGLEGWAGGGDGKDVQRGGIYVYLWLIHVVNRNQQNIVKLLSSN